ncbi:MAG: hypothetical protein NXI16_01470 [Alphaproteobacteria bacterium]|nr:hypothetical protein [Alphaproteobacteria bacterium]
MTKSTNNTGFKLLEAFMRLERKREATFTRTTDGCGIYRAHFSGTDRYYFDFGPCGPRTGWEQFDTRQDGSYFGIWVNPDCRLILTFAEGDVSLETCIFERIFKERLAEMAGFYGDPPPAFTVIDRDGSVTEVYDVRPT